MLVAIQNWFKRSPKTETRTETKGERPADPPSQLNIVDFELRPDDPFMSYLLGANGVVEINKLNLESPALEELKAAGVKICVPLVSQGELIGLLNLGPRRSEQDYNADDRRLLANLATQAAPALRVAQLAQQQQIEARERERIDQELRVARVIQQTLLPKEVPQLEGWEIVPFWQPARAVSGDFYDFIPYPDGRLAIVIADVTDKGVPAALVMATTRSIIRSTAERVNAPGEVLAQVNDLLCPDIPPKMFVTCLYAVLDPTSGKMRYANAGHNVPYLRTTEGLVELRARGMPLGLMPGMPYEEKEVKFEAGNLLLLSSDGLVEGHNAQREMYGFPRLKSLVAGQECGEDLVSCLMNNFEEFTGPGYEQEDDITLLVLERDGRIVMNEEPQLILSFDLPSQPGNERQAARRVIESLSDCGIAPARLQRLETAVAEATMNAMEHGNLYQADVPVHIQVFSTNEKVMVKIVDHGSGAEIPKADAPDLDAKLAGIQSPRGWGLFLIQNMVDEMNVSGDSEHHVIDLVLRREEG